MIITCIRQYQQAATMGEMYVDGEIFGYTCEDIPRPYGVKFAGTTCIPEGVYHLDVTLSSRFKRHMPLIYTEDDYSLVKGGISFTGIRIHGGNTVHDTAGCPILGARTNGVDRVSECSDINERLLDIIKDGLKNEGHIKYIVTSF